jgi:hypothetical protein
MGGLGLRDWAWLYFKASAIVWMLLLVVFTPPQVGNALGGVTWFIAAVTIIGALVSSCGLVLSTRVGLRTIATGIGVELGGLALMWAGPFVYFVTQVYLVCTLPWEVAKDRLALTGLAQLLCAAMVCRIAIVFTRWRRSRKVHPNAGAVI